MTANASCEAQRPAIIDRHGEAQQFALLHVFRHAPFLAALGACPGVTITEGVDRAPYRGQATAEVLA